MTVIEFRPPLVSRITPHPAKFSPPVLQKITEMLEDWGTPDRVIDPFAGTGLVHSIPGINAVGVELEPEWAAMHPRNVVGNALHLPFADGSFTGMISSPTFGNRMADAHNAQDNSVRHTYTHQLGRKLHPDNSGAMQWGKAYRSFHMAAWAEALRVLADDALIVINVSNHIRAGVEQLVVEWHFSWFMDHGCTVVDFDGVPADQSQWEDAEPPIHKVETKRQKHGANGHLRVPYEAVFAFRKGQ